MPAFELSYDEIESTINEISLGGKLVSVQNSLGDQQTLFIKHCTGLDRVLADAEYERAFERSIREGFLTSAETRELLLHKGVVEDVPLEEVQKLEDQIQAQETYLSKLTRVPARRNKTIENIERLKEKLQDLRLKREDGVEFSAERIAAEHKFLFMTWRGTSDPFTGEPYWKTKHAFDNETDLTLRRNLFIEVIKMSSGMEVKVLRYLARNNFWRIRYMTSLKTGISLFGVELPNYTVDQLALAYWSHYYNSIYEMMPEDRPPDYIIEDDPALDAYMKSYMDEINREASAARESKQSTKGGVKSAWEHGETLVMRSNPVYEDVEYSETIESIRNKKASDVKQRNPKSKGSKR